MANDWKSKMKRKPAHIVHHIRHHIIQCGRESTVSLQFTMGATLSEIDPNLPTTIRIRLLFTLDVYKRAASESWIFAVTYGVYVLCTQHTVHTTQAHNFFHFKKYSQLSCAVPTRSYCYCWIHLSAFSSSSIQLRVLFFTTETRKYFSYMLKLLNCVDTYQKYGAFN